MKFSKTTQTWIKIIILSISIALFVLGLIFPILSTKNKILGFVFEYKEIRLFDSASMFIQDKEYLLAFIIVFFTFVFPSIKFLDLINREINLLKFNRTFSSILKYLDKWSMLDVFIVALLVLNFKMDSTIVVMKIKIGTTLLASSIILRMVVANWSINKNK